VNNALYDKFESISLDLIGLGFKHYSADGILHIIRWQTATRGDDPMFKINNNCAAELARLFMMNHPEYDGFFSKRKSKLDAPKYQYDGDQRIFA
jgi:hypothetical protein